MPRRITSDTVRSALLAVVLVGVIALAAVLPATAESSRSAAGDFEIHDDETVYVVADSLGEPRDVVVIDWLRVEGVGTLDVLDPGPLTSAEALKDEIEPRLTPEGVEWTLDVDGRRDFFYRAQSERELPVEVSAAYFLDGRAVEPDELAGETGRVRIEVTVKNSLVVTETVSYADADGVVRTDDVEYWVPMLAPVMIDVDGTRFRNIEADAEIMTVTGSKVSHTFMAFPQPEQTVVIEMDGTDIAIEPIVVSVFPKMAGSPDFSVTDQLGEVRDGLNGLARLSEGHHEVLGAIAGGIDTDELAGLSGVGEGFEQLAAGAREIVTGANGLADLVDGQITYLDGVIGGIRGQDLSGLAQVPGAIQVIGSGVRDTAQGVTGLVALIDGQVAYLDAIAASNAELESMAWDLVAASAGDTVTIEPTSTVEAVTEIATGLSTQTLMIEALRDGNEALGMPLGLIETRDSLDGLATGLGQIADSLDALASGTVPLAGLPGQFEALAAALETLRDGGVVQGQRLPGLVTTREGLRGVAGGIGEVGSGIATAAEGLGALEELPEMLGQLRVSLLAVRDGGTLEGMELPGISATIDGLGAMSDGIGEGLGEASLGEVTVRRMELAAEEYDTFLGKPDRATGDVRFIFRLDGISSAEE